MSEIKKNDLQDLSKTRLDLMNNELLEQANEITPIENYNESNDNDEFVWDVLEEGAGVVIDRITDHGTAWLTGLWGVKGLDISYDTAIRISGFASRLVRALPVVSAVVPPLWESFKYTTIEGEGAEGIINHKYEIAGATVGGIATGAVMAVVLASNPAGWVVLGALGACAVGSFALESIGAYYDSAEVMPADYMSNVYFY